MVAGMLQGQTKADILTWVTCVVMQYVLALQGQLIHTSPHSVICPAIGSVMRCPCPPTLPWPSNPQHGYTLGTCTETEKHISSKRTNIETFTIKLQADC